MSLAHPSRCNETRSKDPSPGGQDSSFMVLSLDFASVDIYDGDKIYLKSQRAGRFCSVGAADDGSYVTCEQYHYDKVT